MRYILFSSDYKGFLLQLESFALLLQEGLSNTVYIFILFIKADDVYAAEITLVSMNHVRNIRALLLCGIFA